MDEKSTIILLYGPSCSGKDLIKDTLIRNIPYIKYLTPYTTRKPRKGEEERKSYFYIDADDDIFRNAIDTRVYKKYNESTCELDTVQYGTVLPKDDDKCSIYVAITSYDGVESFLEHSDEFNIIPVYVNASIDTRASRYLNREAVVDTNRILCKFGSLKEIVRRIESDEKMYNTDSMMNLKKKYPNTNFYTLDNGIECDRNIGIVVTDLKKIIIAEANKKSIMKSIISIMEKIIPNKSQQDLTIMTPMLNYSQFHNTLDEISSLCDMIRRI